MYSTQWCGDCVRSKKVFDKLNIKFTEIDIDFDKDGYEIAKKLQNQNPRIPTIVFEDGSYLVEPSDVELIDKLNSCLLYTSPSPRDRVLSRMPSSA